MQLTIDFDKIFIEELQKEFSTPNVKDALYKLFEFYKNSNDLVQKNLETIEKNNSDYNYIEDAWKRREEGEKTYSLDSVLKKIWKK